MRLEAFLERLTCSGCNRGPASQPRANRRSHSDLAVALRAEELENQQLAQGQ